MPFGVETVRPAVVAIDLHRGHLDPAVATLPLPPAEARRVVAANRAFLARCRALDVPVVHVLTVQRDLAEIRANPFKRAHAGAAGVTRRNVERHQLRGSPGCEVMPELHDRERDWLVDSKKRYNCFVGTDLELTLRAHGVNTLLLTGVNTNSCVLATATHASCLDFAVIVVEDCVATMDGPELHEAALACIRTAFGWTMTGDEALARLAGAPAAEARPT
jgi:nicotinamidase-related amidase